MTSFSPLRGVMHLLVTLCTVLITGLLVKNKLRLEASVGHFTKTFRNLFYVFLKLITINTIFIPSYLLLHVPQKIYCSTFPENLVQKVMTYMSVKYKKALSTFTYQWRLSSLSRAYLPSSSSSINRGGPSASPAVREGLRRWSWVRWLQRRKGREGDEVSRHSDGVGPQVSHCQQRRGGRAAEEMRGRVSFGEALGAGVSV